MPNLYEKYLFVLLLTILLFSKSLYGANEAPIKYLGIAQGLSNNMATCVFRDHYGFMWIGTYNGLNRYDGVAVKIFEKDLKDPKSLVSNHITCITGDTHNKIWIGTNKGLAIYDYANGKILTATLNKGRASNKTNILKKVNAIVSDPKGDVYVGTSGGFLVVKKGTNNCEQIKIKTSTNFNVQALTIDKNGRIWLFVEYMGLGIYDRKSNEVRIINSQLKTLSTMTADPRNENLWLGGESGIFQFDIVSHQLKNTYSAKLNNISVMKIYPDRSMQVWVATDGGGVNLIDLQTGAVTVIGMQKNGPVLSSTAIQDVFKDPDGRLWIATLRGGVNIIDTKSKNQFKTIAKEPENPNSLVSNFTRSFCEDTNGNIWIGTSGGGLSIYNPLTGNFKNFHHQSSVKKSLSSDFVFSIIQDKRANIWIATLKGGINRYLAASNSFKHYQCINPSNSSLIPSIWKLYEDSKQNIWAAGTRGGGLFKYNQLNDRFELFDASLVDITAMYEDRSGDLWMANSSLIKINTINKKHLYVPIGTTIHSIFEDRRGNLWLGTEGEGLLLFNSKNHQIKAFTKNNGLPDNAVLNILEDSSGALWFSTFNGLGKFDFMNGKFRRFYAEDGLQSIQFNFNAALKLRSGDMIFGGLSGFDWFNPDSIKTFVNTPSIYITEFRTNNLSVQQDSAYLGRQNIMDIKHIEVDYHKAEIAVDYVALEYSYPNKINYAYFLEGWDKGWIEVGKNRTAFYSHLDVGQYKLHIRSTNTEGVWAANERIITILILPPWYRTCWAYIICAAIFLSIVYLFWHYRTSQMKLKHEMEITRFKAEKDHEINEKKISFFTDISHEFKTPLTLIMNPIKDLLKTSFGAGNGELKMIYRNAKRLLGLVDQLLLFRKAEEDLHELKITELNLTLLIEEVFQCFISQAKSKALIYNFYHNEDEVMIYADAEKMEIVLFNLIANAISFTPAGGTVDVKLTIDAQDEVKVLISDSGCGIPKGLEEKLFEKYYRVKEGRRSAPGFGIGLFLVKTFVNLHHGNISYTDNPTGGTIFILTLKKGGSSLPSGETFTNTILTDNYRKAIYDQEPLLDQDDQGTTFGQLELLISDRQSILIIDDNKDMRAYIVRIFRDEYRIYEADNGDVGLFYAKKYVPDIIISDINMNGMDGITFCKLLKEDSILSHIPVILITGDANPTLELQGIQIGAVDFVSKPFEKDLLIARVRNISRNKADLQKYFFNQVTLKNNSNVLSEVDRDFLYKCIVIIENNLLEDGFDVQTLADEMTMSYSNLYKRMKLITNGSVKSFMRFVRIRKSAELLINTNCNINEASLSVGINDIKYFRAHFVKIFGINPSEFTKKHRTSFRKKYLKNIID